MNQVSQKNTLERNWAYAPKLDPNGDNIIEQSEKGYIFDYIGPFKKISFQPFFYTYLDLIKTLIILIVTTLAVLNLYATFGCKSRYLQYSRPYQNQIFLFLTIFINVFIVSVQNSDDETNNIYTSTPSLFLLSMIALFLINIVARLGNTWAVFRTPFWPGPFSWWGIIMLSAILIFALDINRLYWKNQDENIFGSVSYENEKYFENFELGALFIVILVVVVRFIIEVINQKKELGGKFNLLKFIFGIDDQNKKLSMKKIKKGEYFCKKEAFEKFDKEVKLGRKKSLYTKLLRYLKLEK